MSLMASASAADTARRRTSSITLGRPAVPAVAGRTSTALGTFCSILVTRPDALDAAADLLSAELSAIDLACSRFRPDSELAAVNRASGRLLGVSPLFAEALAVALRAAEITDGDVDPTCGHSLVRLGYDRDYAELAADTSDLTLPPAPAAGWQCVEFDADRGTVLVPDGVLLDFGATAKALAADRAAAGIARQIRCGVLVNLGGDVAVAGPPPNGGWRVGVDDGVAGAGASTSPGAGRPADPGASAGVDHPAGAGAGAGAGDRRRGRDGAGRRPGQAPVVAIESGGLATSSPSVRGWRRGSRALHHILVPGTGEPAEIYWAAVTVAAASCVDANTASTASIIRGRAAPAWLEEMCLPARLARPDGTVLSTAGWPR